VPQPRPLGDCIDRADGLAKVLAHASLLDRARQILAGVIPPALAAAVRVANVRRGVLVIHADNGAVAAKMRQLGSRICRELLSQGIDCTEISVAVQGAGLPGGLPAAAARPLSAAARAHLHGLLARLPPEDPLALRIACLLERAVKAAAG
jgi:hypothetical protein